MKKQETTTLQMDEIVFENRNKSYGAYILRKLYNKQVNKALLLSVAILAAGLAYPLVSSYNSLNKGKHVWIQTGVDVMTTEQPPEDATPPPPPPPPAAETEAKVKFVAPEVVDDVVEDGGLPDMEGLNLTSVSPPIDLETEKPVEKEVVIIEDPETVAPVISVEEMPSFPGGDAERQRFLAEEIKYPKEAEENGIQGMVYVQFVINSKGNITDVKILRGIGGGCDEEAIRVIKMMPQWKPGRQNGKTVRVLYNMAIGFKLQS